MTETNLISTWIEASTQCGEPIKLALDQLNADLGTRYGHNHLSMWRRGVRQPSTRVVSYMLERCLHYALLQSGLINAASPDSDEIYARLAQQLTT